MSLKRPSAVAATLLGLTMLTTSAFAGESTRVAEKAHDSGVHVVLEIWQEMPHVFQAMSWLPESRHAERHIIDFIRAHTGWDQGAAVQALLVSASGHG